MVDFSSMSVRDYMAAIQEGQEAGTEYDYDALMELEKKREKGKRVSIIRFLKVEKKFQNVPEEAPEEIPSEDTVLTYTEDLSPTLCKFPAKAVDGRGNAYCVIHHSLICIECAHTGVKVDGKLLLKTRCRKICKAHEHSKQVKFMQRGKPGDEDSVAVEGVSLKEFDNA